MTPPAKRHSVRLRLDFVDKSSFFQIFINSFICFQIIQASKLRNIIFDMTFFIQMHLNMHIVFPHDFQIFFTICRNCDNTCSFLSCDKISWNDFKHFYSFFYLIFIIIIMRFKFLPHKIGTFYFIQNLICFLVSQHSNGGFC